MSSPSPMQPDQQTESAIDAPAPPGPLSDVQSNSTTDASQVPLPDSPSSSMTSLPRQDAGRAGAEASSQDAEADRPAVDTSDAPKPAAPADAVKSDPDAEVDSQHRKDLLKYYQNLKVGRRFRTWYLTEMLADKDNTSRPIARRLAEPYFPIKVAVLEWTSLQSPPRTDMFNVGGSQSDPWKRFPIRSTAIPRDKDGDSLRTSLLRPSPEGSTRVIVVEDLSKEVVGTLGVVYGLDYQFFEEHVCPRSDTMEALEGDHLPKPYVHFRWCHPIRVNREEAQRLASLSQDGPVAGAGWSLLKGASTRQSWDLPTHEPIKEKSDWRPKEEKQTFLLSSLNAVDQVPQHSCRNGTREEQVSLYFIPPLPDRGLPSTIIVLADPMLYSGGDEWKTAAGAGIKMFFDKRPSSLLGDNPDSTGHSILKTFMDRTWPDDCGPHAIHASLVSFIASLMRDDTITAVIDMKTEMRAINAARRILHAIENSIDLWDTTLSGIQEQLSIYRQAAKSISAAHAAFQTPLGQSPSPSPSFRRGLFADFGDDYDANKYMKDLLRLIDETLSQATETFNTLRTTLSIYESQQAIAQASAINRLTEMVFIFIPLSFSTSIFGMQMKEFDNVGLATWGIIAGLLLGAILLLRLFASSRIYERLKAVFLDWVRDTQGLPPGSNVAGLDGAIALARHRVLLVWTALILTISFVPAFVWAFAREASVPAKVGWTFFAILIPGAVGFFFPRFFIGRDWVYPYWYTVVRGFVSLFLIFVLPVALLPPLWLAMDAPLDAAVAWTVIICSLSIVGASFWLDVFKESAKEKEMTTTELWAAWTKAQRETPKS